LGLAALRYFIGIENNKLASSARYPYAGAVVEPATRKDANINDLCS